MKTLLFIETAIAIALTVVYWIRPDSLAALTIFPSWMWLLLAVPALPFLRRRHLRHSAIFLSAWALFLVFHAEELRSIVRGVTNPVSEQKPSGALRLITLNCAGGQCAALDELKTLQPDIIFLQESPKKSDVEAFVHEMFGAEGDYVYNHGTSILARWKVTDIRHGEQRLIYSHATVNLPNMGPIDLVSLRLPTGNVRTDLWNPSCWTIHRQHRRDQLNQIQQIVAELPKPHAIIVAGDFNTAQGDKIFSRMPATLYDTFASAGKGIGNTILNNMPILRIDQIWASKSFAPIQSFARKSNSSDHRMVISDVRRIENIQP